MCSDLEQLEFEIRAPKALRFPQDFGPEEIAEFLTMSQVIWSNRRFDLHLATANAHPCHARNYLDPALLPRITFHYINYFNSAFSVRAR